MSSWREFGLGSTHLPSEPLDEETRSARFLPRTLRPVVGDDVRQPSVFDPSLRHHFQAYRAGDPVFDDPAKTVAWARARRAAMDAVLLAVSRSPWARSLVLRGSVLLADRFGRAAREPGDLDFVVVPPTWVMDDGRTARMLDGIAAAADGRAGIKASGAVSEDIWTYDRVPGRRMVLPWSVPGLPDGQVQLDFVFNERLAEPPEPVELACGAVVLAATPALSLAWKVLWLVSDRHPQGKDLYDAVLLAEHCHLPNALVQEVFREAGEWPYPNAELGLAHIADLAPSGYVGAEWEHFEAEYPHLAGPGEEAFIARLVEALRPTFPDAP
ncbi:nucleotidyl transferase AbiEii/AbiGii toxin family protein [Streptomyces sp. NRRL F-2580]|uniref:nucleotidyl transferase AbiEii/AbiGii toxin family protein n=1 Tax=Streptomyces sp. NRRL F-2580 TaxID=1463841 RepID=UPI0004C9ED85|nr:nucleotidyl transferase AbiEii/AbiGii toxin family protein [Streptomyces sp. NRRL F-2580]